MSRLLFVLSVFLIQGVSASSCLGGDFRIPLMPRAPTLDGNIQPDEWSAAAGFGGFAMGGLLERRRIRAWIGATPSHLYFAFKSQLPDEIAEYVRIVTSIKQAYPPSSR